MKLLIPLLVLLFALSASSAALANTVYVTKNKAQADVQVFVVKHGGMATWKAPRASAAKTACRWFFTPHRSRAKLVVFYTQNRAEADLIIRWVSRASDADRLCPVGC
jgi:hypothetical protein